MAAAVVDGLNGLGRLLADIGRRVKRIGYRKQMESGLQRLQAQHQTMFARGVTAGGTKWQMHSEAWARRKGNGSPVFAALIWTGRLNQSLAATRGPDSIREARPDGLSFGTRVPYSQYVVRWAERKGGTAQHVAISDKTLDEITNEIADRVVAELLK